MLKPKDEDKKGESIESGRCEKWTINDLFESCFEVVTFFGTSSIATQSDSHPCLARLTDKTLYLKLLDNDHENTTTAQENYAPPRSSNGTQKTSRR